MRSAAAPKPVDPEIALRDTAFDEFVADRRRLAASAGDAPPVTWALEETWEALPNALRQRYERAAAAKLKATGGAAAAALVAPSVVTAKTSQTGLWAASSFCGGGGAAASVGGGASSGASPAKDAANVHDATRAALSPRPTAVPLPAASLGGSRAGAPAGACGYGQSRGGGGARAGGSGGGRASRQAVEGPPPPHPPEGSTVAELISLLALTILAAVLISRATSCLALQHERAAALAPAPAYASAATVATTADGGRGGAGWPPATLGALARLPSTMAGAAWARLANTSAFASAPSAASDWTEWALINASLAALPPAVPMALDAAQRAADRARTALAADLLASCEPMSTTPWQLLDEGSAFSHVVALLVGSLTALQLASQLVTRARRSCCARSAPPVSAEAAEAKALLLPLTTPHLAAAASDGDRAPSLPLAPWSTLALAELVLAAYATTCFARRPHAAHASYGAGAAGGANAAFDGATDDATAAWRLWFGQASAAHALTLGCAALLACSACGRALQIYAWHRRVAAATAHAATTPAPPGARAAKSGGRASATLKPAAAAAAASPAEGAPLDERSAASRKPRVPAARQVPPPAVASKPATAAAPTARSDADVRMRALVACCVAWLRPPAWLRRGSVAPREESGAGVRSADARAAKAGPTAAVPPPSGGTTAVPNGARPSACAGRTAAAAAPERVVVAPASSKIKSMV